MQLTNDIPQNKFIMSTLDEMLVFILVYWHIGGFSQDSLESNPCAGLDFPASNERTKCLPPQRVEMET